MFHTISLLAVDPAGPLYNPKQISEIDFYPHFQLVSRSDACQVVFLQCNKWMLGSGHNAAHINIAVNGGLFQPSCLFGKVNGFSTRAGRFLNDIKQAAFEVFTFFHFIVKVNKCQLFMKNKNHLNVHRDS